MLRREKQKQRIIWDKLMIKGKLARMMFLKDRHYFLFCVNFFITNARHNAVLRRSPDVYAAPGETKTTHNLGQIDD
ncbi:hypothetical protein A9Y87_16035 [Salmonella enterica subsp. enterica]|nr:hypothetical protein A9Y87_16035 [Salmonella enterica subsp. enterica]